MENSRHIFFQIDTDGIINLLQTSKQLKDKAVLQHTVIYDQGAMALGHPVKSYVVDIRSNEDLHFTILPLKLFSHHKLYFTEFKLNGECEGLSVPADQLIDGKAVSFKLPIQTVSKGSETEFTLYANLEYEEDHKKTTIPLCIDPVLRANQGN